MDTFDLVSLQVENFRDERLRVGQVLAGSPSHTIKVSENTQIFKQEENEMG